MIDRLTRTHRHLAFRCLPTIHPWSCGSTDTQSGSVVALTGLRACFHQHGGIVGDAQLGAAVTIGGLFGEAAPDAIFEHRKTCWIPRYFRPTLEVLLDLMLQIRNKQGDSRVNCGISKVKWLH